MQVGKLYRAVTMSAICALSSVIGSGRPAAAMSPQPKAMAPKSSDSGADDLEAFFISFWSEQFGVKYAAGESGMVLEAVNDGDPLPDQEASHYWNVLVMVNSRPTDSNVVAKGLFLENFRAPLKGYEYSPEQLAMANLRSVSRLSVAGIVHSDPFGPRHVFGELIEMTLSDGRTGVAFVPGGVADDAASAEAGARSFLVPLAAPGSSGSTSQGLVERLVQVSLHDCAKEQQLCYDAAISRYRACIDNAKAITIGCLGTADAACYLGCIATGPAYGACLLTCVLGSNAVCLLAESKMFSGCKHELEAALLDCQRARLQCDREDRAGRIDVKAGGISTDLR